jgi:hypothetical protein
MMPIDSALNPAAVVEHNFPFAIIIYGVSEGPFESSITLGYFYDFTFWLQLYIAVLTLLRLIDQWTNIGKGCRRKPDVLEISTKAPANAAFFSLVEFSESVAKMPIFRVIEKDYRGCSHPYLS